MKPTITVAVTIKLKPGPSCEKPEGFEKRIESFMMNADILQAFQKAGLPVEDWDIDFVNESDEKLWMITAEEQKRRVDGGLGWILCDHCEEPAVLHDHENSDEYLCNNHFREIIEGKRRLKRSK